MKELYRFRQFLAEGVIKENISSHKEEAKRFLEKFVDDNEDKFEFIPDLETGYIDVNDNSYNVDELASIFLDIGQDIPRGTHNQKYKGEGGTYVVVSEGVNELLKENLEEQYPIGTKFYKPDGNQIITILGYEGGKVIIRAAEKGDSERFGSGFQHKWPVEYFPDIIKSDRMEVIK